MTAPQVREDFKNLIPPLDAEERRLMEYSIGKEGCREPLVTWNGIIVDGHNRFEICTRLRIPYETKPIAVELADEIAAKIWIANNQFGRRNLNAGQKSALAHRVGLLEEAARVAAERRTLTEGRPKAGANKLGVALPQVYREPKSVEVVAKQIGVGASTVRRVKYIGDRAPEQLDRILRGEITANAAYLTLRAADSQAPTNIRAGRFRNVNADLPNTIDRGLLPKWCIKIINQSCEMLRQEIQCLDTVQVPFEGNYPVDGYYLKQVKAAQAAMRTAFECLLFPIETKTVPIDRKAAS